MIVPFAELFFPVSAVELSFLRFFLVLFFVELFSLSFVIFPVPLLFVGIFLLPTILATCVAEEVVPTWFLAYFFGVVLLYFVDESRVDFPDSPNSPLLLVIR